MIHHQRLTAIVAVAALGFAACSGSDTADSTIPPATNTVETTTSTTSTTTTVTTEVPTTTEAPPSTEEPTTIAETPIEVALDDFEYVIEELSRRRVAMYAEPNLDAIPGICAIESLCEDLYMAQVGEQIELGERTVGEPSIDVTEFEIIGFDKDTLEESAAVVVQYTRAPLGADLGAIVDAEGNVVFELAVDNPDQPGRGQINLVRNNEPGLPWRIVEQKSLGPA